MKAVGHKTGYELRFVAPFEELLAATGQEVMYLPSAITEKADIPICCEKIEKSVCMMGYHEKLWRGWSYGYCVLSVDILKNATTYHNTDLSSQRTYGAKSDYFPI